MESKICFKCLVKKPLSDYYKHKMMGDGHLNKCKECAKADVREKHADNFLDPAYVTKQRARGRDKYKRLNYKGQRKPTTDQKRTWTNNYKANFPEKQAAKLKCGKMHKPKGMNLHHWSYNEEHYKDVIEVTTERHYFIHRFLLYDQEKMMYRTLANELLDTREKHVAYIDQLKEDNT